MAPPTRTSIFARRMLKEREDKVKAHSSQVGSVPDPATVLGEKSYVLTGPEADEIHRQNIETLAKMTKEEIEEERQILMRELDPGILAFIKNKRAKPAPLIESSSSEKFESQQNSEGVKDMVCDFPDVSELANKYPHMDVIEKEKLEWTGELSHPELPPPDKPFNARFNFEGMLLPYADSGEGVLKGLHNHGEEQERPGYSLQELMQLSRSSVLQQRVLALTTIANILAKASTYADCLEEPLLPKLLDAELFLLLRFSLDDVSSPVVMASTLTMCNLIVNHTDETCLDVMLGTPLGIQQPSLGVIIEMKPSEIEELKDQELLRLDIIRGAVRTDILARIKYILTDLKPEPVEIKHMLKTVTRIARHSYEMAEAVFICPSLLSTVRSLLNIRSTSYFPEALKLFRVLIARSHSMASTIIENYSIMSPIFKFIAGERGEGHPEAMHLTLESFYTWQTLLSYNIGTATIGEFTPVLMRLLEAHFGLTNLSSPGADLEHATALVSTLSTVAKVDFSQIQHLFPLATRCTMKWLSQLISSQHLIMPASKLVGALLHFMAISHSQLGSPSELIKLVEKLLRSPCFSSAAQTLRSFSWLLRGKIDFIPENLPCLGSIPPTLRYESSFPLVHGLVTYILATSDPVSIRLFISNNEILSYIEDIVKCETMNSRSSHWYARQELSLLVATVHLYTVVMDEEALEIFHTLAFLLLTSVQSGDKYLLPHIISKGIFSPQFFRTSVDKLAEKLQDMTVQESSESSSFYQPKEILDLAILELGEIEKCYQKEFGFDVMAPPWPPITLTGLLNATTPALPADWPFVPILRLYNSNGVGSDSEQVSTRCLQWILLLEESPCKVVAMSITAKYCRLSCLFLAGNDLFRDLTPLLEAVLKCLLRNSKDLDFDEAIPGLKSFYDFYRELLEQYAGVSYCDPVFGQYILVPLQQRHHSKFKKLLWSEQAAILRLLSTPLDQVNIAAYTSPSETDPDLLMTYLHALATSRIRFEWCPVLYMVAVHHVSTYMKTNNTNFAQKIADRVEKLGNQGLRALLTNYEGVEFWNKAPQ